MFYILKNEKIGEVGKTLVRQTKNSDLEDNIKHASVVSYNM